MAESELYKVCDHYQFLTFTNCYLHPTCQILKLNPALFVPLLCYCLYSFKHVYACLYFSFFCRFCHRVLLHCFLRPVHIKNSWCNEVIFLRWRCSTLLEAISYGLLASKKTELLLFFFSFFFFSTAACVWTVIMCSLYYTANRHILLYCFSMLC